MPGGGRAKPPPPPIEAENESNDAPPLAGGGPGVSRGVPWCPVLAHNLLSPEGWSYRYIWVCCPIFTKGGLAYIGRVSIVRVGGKGWVDVQFSLMELTKMGVNEKWGSDFH